MKKIIATVLAMVMALALCTTAFAVGPITENEKAKVPTAETGDTVAADVTLEQHREGPDCDQVYQ